MRIAYEQQGAVEAVRADAGVLGGAKAQDTLDNQHVVRCGGTERGGDSGEGEVEDLGPGEKAVALLALEGAGGAGVGRGDVADVHR